MVSESARQKEQAIRRAALKIFRQKGYHRASIREIAEAAGIQKGSVYYYVPRKEDLLADLLEQDLDELTAQTQPIVKSNLAPEEKLRQAVINHLDFITQHLDGLAIILQDLHSLGAENRAAVVSKTRLYQSLFQSIVEEGVKSGDFCCVDAKTATRALLGMCNAVVTWYSPDGPLSAREVADIFSSLLLNGLLSCPSDQGSRERSAERKVVKRVKELRHALENFRQTQIEMLSDIERAVQRRPTCGSVKQADHTISPAKAMSAKSRSEDPA